MCFTDEKSTKSGKYITKSKVILHDYFEYPDGGGRLTLFLSKILNAPIGYGFKKHNHPFFADEYKNIKDFNLNSYAAFPVIKQLSLIKAFLLKTKFLQKYDIVFYSGAYAPLSIKNHSTGFNIYYCHTPPRFIYDQKKLFLLQQPFWLKPFMKFFLFFYKKYYASCISKMDVVLTNSINVQKRIKQYLGMESVVVYPPCDTSRFVWLGQKDYYLSTARLDSLKRIDIIVEAFLKMPDKKLVIISNGSLKKKILQLIGNAKHIIFMNQVSDSQLLDLIGYCIATIYIPINEDFGMSPIESMSAGKPVIGVAEGGLTESIIHNKTGFLLNPDFTVKDLISFVMEMDTAKALHMRNDCEIRAKRFDINTFKQNIHTIIKKYNLS